MKAFRQIAVCLLCLVGVVVSGCKTGGHSDSGEGPAHPAKKRNYPGADDQNPADPSAARGSPSPGQSPSDRTTTRISGQGQQSANSDSSDPETYEGGDAKLYSAPKHFGTPRERIETTKPSTPTPTPNRPIDRPLDPAGRPLSSATPEG